MTLCLVCEIVSPACLSVGTVYNREDSIRFLYGVQIDDDPRKTSMEFGGSQGIKHIPCNGSCNGFVKIECIVTLRCLGGLQNNGVYYSIPSLSTSFSDEKNIFNRILQNI